MTIRTTAAALALLLAAGIGAQAQQTQQTQPARPGQPAPAAQTAPARQAPAAQTAPARAPLINVNSATAEDLEKLPQIGPARSKAIIENRAAGKGGAYKDMADLEKRANLPSNAVAAIKDLVRFR